MSQVISMKKRIEYIDLAKGLCILLVISLHIDMGKILYANEQVANFFYAFRMPLYYILSGLFLSINGGRYTDFVQKKINRLLVPFVFFVILSNIYIYIKHIFIHSSFHYVSPLYFLLTESSHEIHNAPLWFLASLFNTYMIFTFMHYVYQGSAYKIYITSLGLGYIGYMLGIHGINVPFYLDTSLTCVPFVCIGIIIRKTKILAHDGGGNSKLFNIAFSVLCFFIVYILHCGENQFHKNEYNNSYFIVLLAGICGSLGIISLSKTIVKFPVISYIGRYSIIVLGTHNIIINEMDSFVLGFFLDKIPHPILLWEITTLIVVIVISCIFIHLFVKYIPYLVAQQDFVRFTFSKR